MRVIGKPIIDFYSSVRDIIIIDCMWIAGTVACVLAGIVLSPSITAVFEVIKLKICIVLKLVKALA